VPINSSLDRIILSSVRLSNGSLLIEVKTSLDTSLCPARRCTALLLGAAAGWRCNRRDRWCTIGAAWIASTRIAAAIRARITTTAIARITTTAIARITTTAIARITTAVATVRAAIAISAVIAIATTIS
jgi:hypothetical protein